jgi:zinc protease
MKTILRTAFAAALAALALSSAPVASEAHQPARTETYVWPHDGVDIAPDPAVKYGTLPNGMRYALMRNTQPAGIASIRLRIAAGAMSETDAQRGIAHFLEHMNFNGSQNVPEGEMVKLLQRAGLAFGPDTNAYTSFGETVYMLDLPKTDAATVDTGLMIMRETANRLTLDAAAIDRERGIILSEERARDTPEYRSLKAQFTFLLKDQPLTTRWPIGVQETIRTMPRSEFVSFYQGNYRPERALLVIVGDIDVAAIETKIREQFADWTQPGPPDPAPSYGTVARRRAEAVHRVEAGLPANVSLTWASPPDLARDSAARQRMEMVRDIAFAAVNRRLERIARQADAPFISASVSRSVLEKSATLASIDVDVRPGRWQTGMSAAEQELRRALQFGVSQAEIDREMAEMKAGYESAAASAATRDTRRLAGGIVGAFDDNEVFAHPSTALQIFNASSTGLSAATANAALRAAFKPTGRSGGGPLIFVSGSEEIPGGDAAILAAYRQSAAQRVTPPVAEAEAVFAYSSFGAPGAVASRTQNGEFDLDLVRFQNGVLLTLKKTPFDEKRINVSVRLRGGLAYADRVAPGVPILAPFVMAEAGLGKMTREEIERATAGKVVGAGFSFGEDEFVISGRTRAEDLDLQMQLLAAQVSDPAFRPDGLSRIKASAENFIRQYATAPGRVLDRDSGAYLRSGDVRWAFPTLDQAKALEIDDFRRLIEGSLTTQPLEISVVGDFDAEAVIQAVAKTFGALPPRTGTPAQLRNVAFPRGATQPLQWTHEGRADQAVAFIAWPSVDFTDARKARAVRLALTILDDRLTEEYREALGATYSPLTEEDLSQVFTGYGYVAAQVETPPGDLGRFWQTVDKITAELRDGRISADSIVRARAPVVDQLRTSERSNNYWVAVLQDAQTNPRRFDLMRTRVSDVEAITKDEIVAAARATFMNDKAVRIIVTPKQ